MDDHDVELLLSRMSSVQVVTHSHRAALKARLLESAREQSCGKSTRRLRWPALACSAVFLVAASGWAAQQAYWKYFIVDEHVCEAQVMPDGTVQVQSETACIVTDDLQMTQQGASQKWQATQAAIARGDYLLLDVTRGPANEIYYHYSVLLEDGDAIAFGSSRPLP